MESAANLSWLTIYVFWRHIKDIRNIDFEIGDIVIIDADDEEYEIININNDLVDLQNVETKIKQSSSTNIGDLKLKFSNVLIQITQLFRIKRKEHRKKNKVIGMGSQEKRPRQFTFRRH